MNPSSRALPPRGLRSRYGDGKVPRTATLVAVTDLAWDAIELASVVSILLKYRYWIIVPLSVLEGPMVAVAAGALSSLGYFNPYIACALFVAKDVTVDGVYYYLGRVAGDHPFYARLLARLHVTASDIERVRGLWNARGWRTMFVAKLALGLSPLFLAVAGIVGVPVGRFFRLAVSVALLQYVVLFLLGYYFGDATATVSRALRIVQFAVVIGALSGFVYLRRRLRA
jgi:membrane protein DedA with SNARE-associated domain